MPHKNVKRGRRRRTGESPPDAEERSATAHPIRLFGLHAVEAALRNPARPVRRLAVTANAANRLATAIAARGVDAETARPQDLDRLLGPGTVHQGVLLETVPLSAPDLEDLADSKLVVVLDKITDPQNVGAILRSAAAFGADAVVTLARQTPPLAGVTAKAASGALEHVPVVPVSNLARALESLGRMGFWRVGLDGAAEETLEAQDPAPPLALVLGAEGKGLRRLTRERCDQLCRLSTIGPISSLNVSNAAAVALHTVRMAAGP